MGWILTTSEGIVLTIKATPRASKNEIAGADADWLRIRLKAPPVDGKANEALVKFMAETLSVPKSDITITSGTTARLKRVRISGITEADAAARLR